MDHKLQIMQEFNQRDKELALEGSIRKGMIHVDRHVKMRFFFSKIAGMTSAT